jgi:hypothetical protein
MAKIWPMKLLTGLQGRLPAVLNLFFVIVFGVGRGSHEELRGLGKRIRQANPLGDRDLQTATPEQGHSNLIHYQNQAQEKFACFSFSPRYFTFVISHRAGAQIKR